MDIYSCLSSHHFAHLLHLYIALTIISSCNNACPLNLIFLLNVALELKLRLVGCQRMMMSAADKWLWFFTMVTMILQCSNGVVDSGRVPAMFVFGDSLVDVGNNNYLSSIAKSNYFPYGVDFYNMQPTGRFCNGKTFVDMLGNFLSQLCALHLP